MLSKEVGRGLPGGWDRAGSDPNTRHLLRNTAPLSPLEYRTSSTTRIDIVGHTVRTAQCDFRLCACMLRHVPLRELFTAQQCVNVRTGVLSDGANVHKLRKRLLISGNHTLQLPGTRAYMRQGPGIKMPDKLDRLLTQPTHCLAPGLTSMTKGRSHKRRHTGHRSLRSSQLQWTAIGSNTDSS